MDAVGNVYVGDNTHSRRVQKISVPDPSVLALLNDVEAINDALQANCQQSTARIAHLEQEVRTLQAAAGTHVEVRQALQEQLDVMSESSAVELRRTTEQRE